MKERIYINDLVETPDGKGIVKEIKELYHGDIGFTCLLEVPYKIINPRMNNKEYGFPAYSFGYQYTEDKLKKL